MFDLSGEIAAVALAAGVVGATALQVVAIVGMAILVVLAAKAAFKGIKWATKEATRLYNEKSKHAKKRHKVRQISDDMIDQAIKTGKKTKGNKKGTIKYKGRKIWVVVNGKTGKVVSTGWN